jgi:hypothetical protein
MVDSPDMNVPVDSSNGDAQPVDRMTDTNISDSSTCNNNKTEESDNSFPKKISAKTGKTKVDFSSEDEDLENQQDVEEEDVDNRYRQPNSEDSDNSVTQFKSTDMYDSKIVFSDEEDEELEYVDNGENVEDEDVENSDYQYPSNENVDMSMDDNRLRDPRSRASQVILAPEESDDSDNSVTQFKSIDMYDSKIVFSDEEDEELEYVENGENVEDEDVENSDYQYPSNENVDMSMDDNRVRDPRSRASQVILPPDESDDSDNSVEKIIRANACSRRIVLTDEEDKQLEYEENVEDEDVDNSDQHPHNSDQNQSNANVDVLMDGNRDIDPLSLASQVILPPQEDNSIVKLTQQVYAKFPGAKGYFYGWIVGFGTKKTTFKV